MQVLHIQMLFYQDQQMSHLRKSRLEALIPKFTSEKLFFCCLLHVSFYYQLIVFIYLLIFWQVALLALGFERKRNISLKKIGAI